MRNNRYMRKNEPKTALLARLRMLTPEQRKTWAKLAGTSVTYLYALGTCSRRTPSASKALAIADASRTLAGRWKTPGLVISVEEIATMCDL